MKQPIIRHCLACGLCVLSVLTGFSQENRTPATLQGDPKCDIHCRILNYFSHAHISSECGTAFFFTKFNVSADGKIIDIRFSNGSLVFMQTFMKEALISTSNAWNPEKLNSKSVESKSFVLPVIYSFENRCKESVDTILIVHGKMYTATPILLDYPDYKTRQGYSFMHMLDFSSQEDSIPKLIRSTIFPQVDGYILSPVYLSKTSY